eukprot:7717155-Alexandrium_andersonii.AAC.1
MPARVHPGPNSEVAPPSWRRRQSETAGISVAAWGSSWAVGGPRPRPSAVARPRPRSALCPELRQQPGGQ